MIETTKLIDTEEARRRIVILARESAQKKDVLLLLSEMEPDFHPDDAVQQLRRAYKKRHGQPYDRKQTDALAQIVGIAEKELDRGRAQRWESGKIIDQEKLKQLLYSLDDPGGDNLPEIMQIIERLPQAYDILSVIAAINQIRNDVKANEPGRQADCDAAMRIIQRNWGS